MHQIRITFWGDFCLFVLCLFLYEEALPNRRKKKKKESVTVIVGFWNKRKEFHFQVAIVNYEE